MPGGVSSWGILIPNASSLKIVLVFKTRRKRKVKKDAFGGVNNNSINCVYFSPPCSGSCSRRDQNEETGRRRGVTFINSKRNKRNPQEIRGRKGIAVMSQYSSFSISIALPSPINLCKAPNCSRLIPAGTLKLNLDHEAEPGLGVVENWHWLASLCCVDELHFS